MPRQHSRLPLTALVPLLALLPAAPASAQTEGGTTGTQPTARYIVAVDLADPAGPEGSLPPAEVPEQRDEIAAAQAELVDAIDDGGTVLADFTTIPYSVVQATPAEVDRLRANGTITGAVPDRLAQTSLDESTTQIGADTVWGTSEGDGRMVAIIDTGVQDNHAFFGTRVNLQACFADDAGIGPVGDCPNGQSTQTTGTDPARPCDPDDNAANTQDPDCDHGTHVAGIAASSNGSYTGVAPSADIMAIQVFHDTSTTTVSAWLSDVALALEHVDTYAAAHANVVAAANLSLGSGLFSGACDNYDGGAIRAVVQSLANRGVAVVASSGNDGSASQISFPACVTGVISVGNVFTSKSTVGDPDDVSGSSNASPSLDLLAPGSPIRSSIPDYSMPFNTSATLSGTSMAAPHVTGSIALLREERAAEINALPVAERIHRVHGLLDATGVCIADPGNNRVYRRIDVGAAADFTGAPGALFDDVASCAWYEDAVNWLLFEELAEGYDDNTFRGDLNITRAQVTRMIHRLFGSPNTGHEHPFSDVPTWVEDAVDWINDPAGPGAPQPLANGYDNGTFRPDNNITRGEVTRMLYRAAGEPSVTGFPQPFSDVPAWLDSAVRWIARDLDAGGPLEPIATGYDNGTFRDTLNITRAQVTRMLQRFDAVVDP